MNLPKELATKACDGMEFICSDMQSLFKELNKSNPLAAEYIKDAMQESFILKAKINLIYNLLGDHND